MKNLLTMFGDDPIARVEKALMDLQTGGPCSPRSYLSLAGARERSIGARWSYRRQYRFDAYGGFRTDGCLM